MKKKTAFRSVGLLMTALAGLAAGGCQDEDLKQACTELCEQRIACDKEKGATTTTSQGNCETACLLQGNSIVEKDDECSSKESCEYTTCIEE